MMGSRGHRVVPEDWDRHKDEIVDLYITHDMTLKKVMETMRSRHGFIAR